VRGRAVLAEHGQQFLVRADEVGLVARPEPGAPPGRVLQHLAVGTSDGQVLILDTATGMQKALIAGGTSINALAFSPDGSILASSTNGAIVLWDLATQQQITSLHTILTGGIGFTADGRARTVVNGAYTKNEIQLWNTSYLVNPTADLCAIAELATPGAWAEYAAGTPYPRVCPWNH